MCPFSRRSFLKRAGVAAAGAGGYAHARAAGMSPDGPTVKVRLAEPDEPLVRRAFAVFQDRVQARCGVEVVETHEAADIVFDTDGVLSHDAFRIDEADGAVRVCGGSPRGLFYGVGKLLRGSVCGETFAPTRWRGLSEPRGSLRGMYFATHFHNWYHREVDGETVRYMEDLALWGVNAIMVAIPFINLRGWDDPATEPAMEMLRQYARAAHGLGLQFVTGLNNVLFSGAPEELRATRLPDPLGRRGNSGHPICPSTPEGHAYILDNTREVFERLREVGLDAVCFWPYDEGGCACEACRPWGCNGYLKLSSEMTELGRAYFPDLKTVLSTWMFDTPPEGEWQGLADLLARDGKWVDYILADAHEDYPRYPLDVGVPGDRPLLNFPEISMWGNAPWGGYGANPLPGRFQRLWDQVKAVVRGGFPYSEGIYEDMNKILELQFYWDADRTAKDILTEYVTYEFGPGVEEDTLAMVDCFENAASASYRGEPVDTDGVKRARALAEDLHGRLPDWGRRNWRWELLYLRAILDQERFAGDGLETPAAEAAMRRLIEIYHCQVETDDPYHHRVRPPLRGAVSRRGQA